MSSRRFFVRCAVVVVSGCGASAPATRTSEVHVDPVDASAATELDATDARAAIASHASDAGAAPSLPDAPSGFVVHFRARRCFYDEPTDGGCGIGGSCVATIDREVACPPASEVLHIDVQEGLQGHVVIAVDGVTVFSEEVRSASLTGRVGSVVVRPRHWPADVVVHAPRSNAHVSVPHATPFLAIHGAPVATSVSAQAFEYE